MEIKFTCKTCNKVVENKFRSIDGFKISGYESSVLWAGSEEGVPHQNDEFFELLNNTPKVNEKRVVKVKEPFTVNTENHFWAFYQPALSMLNGLSEHIEEIEDCAFVKCKILSVISISETEAWLQVLVMEVITLSQAINEIPQKVEKQSLWDDIYCFEYSFVKYKNWIFCEGSGQSDLGNWLIISNEGKDFNLIAMGEWSFHQDTAYLGNLKLKEETYSRIFKEPAREKC